MGCGSSAPAVGDEVQQQQTNTKVPAAAAAAKQVTDSNGSKAAVPAVSVADKSPAVASGKAESDKAKSSTRARRLSYVTADKNGVAAPAAELDVADGLAAVDAIDTTPVPEPSPTPPQADAGMRMTVALVSRAGKEPGFRKTNQDNCLSFEKFITADQSLFAAMDGHGPHGHLVSGFVKQHLPIMLINHLSAPAGSADPKHALSAAFNEVHNTLAASRIDCEFSGSTAVVSYLKGKTLTTAWVGDSRGVIAVETAPGVLEAVDLTLDHKPTLPEERERILQSNGRVERLVDEYGEPMGPHRVWLQHAWIPGLAMSRALGDVLAHQLGVSSDPQHSTVELDRSHKFMVLASDGVWEFISSKEAVDIVAQYDNVEEACQQLVEEAHQRWLTEEEGVVDDITAVIVRFDH